MFRTGCRSVRTLSSLAPARTVGAKRFISTAPANARRSWKSSAARWAIAIAGIYYYSTSPVFAEQPQSRMLRPMPPASVTSVTSPRLELTTWLDFFHHPNSLDAAEDHADSSILDALTSRRSRESEKEAEVLPSSAVDVASPENVSTPSEAPLDVAVDGPGHGSAAELEHEAASEGAFNPETGEINWDCPCLGGMAHGPCGPEFREAFSCFVFSTEEPKGMDCIEKFKGMQECFQRYPDVYKGELEDDDELDESLEPERQELVKEIAERQAAQQQQKGEGPPHRLLEEPAPVSHEKSASSATVVVADSDVEPLSPERENIYEGPTSAVVRRPRPVAVAEDAVPEADELVPKAAHDARGPVGPAERKAEN